jgi:hypothetical protein
VTSTASAAASAASTATTVRTDPVSTIASGQTSTNQPSVTNNNPSELPSTHTVSTMPMTPIDVLTATTGQTTTSQSSIASSNPATELVSTQAMLTTTTITLPPGTTGPLSTAATSTLTTNPISTVATSEATTAPSVRTSTFVLDMKIDAFTWTDALANNQSAEAIDYTRTLCGEVRESCTNVFLKIIAKITCLSYSRKLHYNKLERWLN